MDHTLVARDASTSLVKSQLSLVTVIRIMDEMEKDENKHRVRNLYLVSKRHRRRGVQFQGS